MDIKYMGSNTFEKKTLLLLLLLITERPWVEISNEVIQIYK